MSNEAFKQEIADKLNVSFEVIDNEVFSGCAMLFENVGDGDHVIDGFIITDLTSDLVDEEEALEYHRQLAREGKNVDMTAYSFSDSESFTIEYQGVKLVCSQVFNRHVDEDFTRNRVTGEIVKRDWTFSGMMEMTTYSVV
tara:strand:- start:1116 stop:1535 length:420 start_codon:yes stop_codon:yes gene_type:complete